MMSVTLSGAWPNRSRTASGAPAGDKSGAMIPDEARRAHDRWCPRGLPDLSGPRVVPTVTDPDRWYQARALRLGTRKYHTNSPAVHKAAGSMASLPFPFERLRARFAAGGFQSCSTIYHYLRTSVQYQADHETQARREVPGPCKRFASRVPDRLQIPHIEKCKDHHDDPGTQDTFCYTLQGYPEESGTSHLVGEKGRNPEDVEPARSIELKTLAEAVLAVSGARQNRRSYRTGNARGRE